MNNIETISRYFKTTLSTTLNIPVYIDNQENKDKTYCVFFILDGTPRKYVANNIAWVEFDVRVNIWSSGYEFAKMDSIINTLDGVQGVTVTNGSNTGYIQSIVYNRQTSLKDKDFWGLQAQFTVKVK